MEASATHPPCLWSLLVRGLPWVLRGLLPPGLLKRFCKDQYTVASPELPQDILMSIFDTLEIPDLIRASSVCASWRSAYTSLRNSLGQYRRPQTPCLLYTSDSDGDNVVCLYSLAEKRSYKLTIPDPAIRTRRFIGSSSRGWLVTVDERSEMHLVNPITGEQIALPSVVTIEQVNPVFDEHGVVSEYELPQYSGIDSDVGPPSVFALGELRDNMHYKAFVFFDTSTDTYIVVLIHNPLCQLSFARLGDDKWTWLPHGDLYQDCLYKDGLLYAVTIRMVNEIHVFDLSGPVVTRKTVISVTDHLHCLGTYIAQAPSGDLLLIARACEDSDLEAGPGGSVFWNTTGFEIYQIDSTGSKAERINSLPDQVFFLGHNQSLCLRAQEYLALKANHCYFTDDCALWIFGLKNSHRDIKVLNLRDNSTEELVSPQLWSNSPAPVWITPDLRKMSLASGLGLKKLKGSTNGVHETDNTDELGFVF